MSNLKNCLALYVPYFLLLMEAVGNKILRIVITWQILIKYMIIAKEKQD